MHRESSGLPPPKWAQSKPAIVANHVCSDFVHCCIAPQIRAQLLWCFLSWLLLRFFPDGSSMTSQRSITTTSVPCRPPLRHHCLPQRETAILVSASAMPSSLMTADDSTRKFWLIKQQTLLPSTAKYTFPDMPKTSQVAHFSTPSAITFHQVMKASVCGRRSAAA